MSGYFEELELTVFNSKPDEIYDFVILLEDDYVNYDVHTQELLNKILKSLQLIKSDVTYKIISCDKLNTTSHKFKRVINFGNKNLTIAHQSLLAPSLVELQSQPALKKQLWEQLQIFCKS